VSEAQSIELDLTATTTFSSFPTIKLTWLPKKLLSWKQH